MALGIQSCPLKHANLSKLQGRTFDVEHFIYIAYHNYCTLIIITTQ